MLIKGGGAARDELLPIDMQIARAATTAITTTVRKSVSFYLNNELFDTLTVSSKAENGF